MNNAISSRYKAILLALSGFLCFSVTDAIGKALIPVLDVFTLNFWIAAVSVGFFLIFSPFLGGLQATLRTNHRKWHLVRAVLTGLIPLLNFYALAHMPLVNFYTIVFTAPFFTAIFARFMVGERTDAQGWFLIILGFLGVVIALRPDPTNFGWPEGAVILSAIIFAIRNLTVVKMGHDETLLSYGLFGYLAIMIFSAVPMMGHFVLPPLWTFGPLLLSGILAGAGIIVFSLAFRYAPSSVVAPTHYSQILWGLILGYVFFQDFPDIWMCIGSLIVIVCGLWMLRKSDADA
jgi:S-adenosylmethionine uptake transporter